MFPLAAIHAHGMALPPRRLTNEVLFFGSSAVSLLCAFPSHHSGSTWPWFCLSKGFFPRTGQALRCFNKFNRTLQPLQSREGDSWPQRWFPSTKGTTLPSNWIGFSQSSYMKKTKTLSCWPEQHNSQSHRKTQSTIWIRQQVSLGITHSCRPPTELLDFHEREKKKSSFDSFSVVCLF